MAVTPIYTTPINYFPRSYLSGFVGCVGCSNFRWAGVSTLVCDFAGGYRFDLVVRPNVYLATSNAYSLDYIFDAAASQVYSAGLPVPSGMWFGFYVMQSQPEYRIHILSSLAVDENQLLDLPPMPPGYWRTST